MSLQDERPSFLKAFGPAVFWAALLFAESSIPAQAFPESPILAQDKLIHMGIYGVFGFLLYRGLRLRGPASATVAGWVTLIVCSLYGASDEFHQHFVPGRSMDVYDWLADTIGVALAIGIARYLEMRRARAVR